ncbi:MAG TPA: hypothetical protein VF011_14105 [Terriglobales bacterium]
MINFTLTITPTSISVNGGQKAVYTVTINGVYLSGNPTTGGLTRTVTARLGVKN